MAGASSAQIPSRKAARISAIVARGCVGILCFLACHQQTTINPEAINKPGKIPALNKREIDCSAITPQITNAIEGGIKGAKIPALTATAVAKGLL